MTGLGIRVFTDEMITPRVATQLSRRGYDVVSCHRANRANLGISDREQLDYATNEGRAIYTFNGADFLELHQQWQASGRAHAGIIVSVDLNTDIPDMVRRLRHHLDTTDPPMQHNRIRILWPLP